MVVLSIAHIFQKGSNLLVCISKITILGKVDLLFFNRAHNSFGISVLFQLALGRLTNLRLIMFKQISIGFRHILHTRVAVMYLRADSYSSQNAPLDGWSHVSPLHSSEHLHQHSSAGVKI
jgi:hypothetical protein